MKHVGHDARLCGHRAAALHGLMWAVMPNCQEPALRHSVMRTQRTLPKSLQEIWLEMKLAGAKGW